METTTDGGWIVGHQRLRLLQGVAHAGSRGETVYLDQAGFGNTCGIGCRPCGLCVWRRSLRLRCCGARAQWRGPRRGRQSEHERECSAQRRGRLRWHHDTTARGRPRATRTRIKPRSIPGRLAIGRRPWSVQASCGSTQRACRPGSPDESGRWPCHRRA